MVSVSDDLARTRALFEQWRATRVGRPKIPDPLWEAAVALHGRYSASQLCRELHVSAGALRSHLPKATPETAGSRPAFVPLPAEPWKGLLAPLPTGAAEEIRLVCVQRQLYFPIVLPQPRILPRDRCRPV